MSGRFWVEDKLIDDGHLAELDGSAWKFLTVVIRHANKDGECFLGRDRIMRTAGINSTNTFYKARAELSSLLEYETHNGKATTYRLIPCLKNEQGDESPLLAKPCSKTEQGENLRPCSKIASRPCSKNDANPAQKLSNEGIEEGIGKKEVAKEPVAEGENCSRSSEFDRLWECLPTRIDGRGNRAVAEACWNQLSRKDRNQLVSAAAVFARNMENRDPQYIKSASKFITEETWRDFAPSPRKKPNNSPRPIRYLEEPTQ